MVEQGPTAEVAFDAVNGTIDSMSTTTILSHCKLNSYAETAEGQRHNENFIYWRGSNLSPLTNGFVSARWVSLHPGTDVISLNSVKPGEEKVTPL